MKFKKYSLSHRARYDELMKKRGMVDANFFHEVVSIIPSSLKLIDKPDTLERQMNCHGFTFNKGVWFETPKVYQLILEDKLIELSKPKQDCIILYIDAERNIPIIYHSGIYLGNGMVRSKWSNGTTFEHKVFDSPHSYGQSVKFYKLNLATTS